MVIVACRNFTQTFARMRFLTIAIALACLSAAAGPLVSNRLPVAGDLGYRPADGRLSEMNPPSLAWLPEKDAQTYRVQWAANTNFTGAITISNLLFNTYTHDAALKVGTYFWRYGFATTNGAQSDWSAMRRFRVGESSVVFPLPSKKDRTKLIPSGHPRLFMRFEDLPRMKAAANGSLKGEFSKLVRAADALVGAKLVEEPRQPGTASVKTNTTLLQNWWANRVQTLKACTEAETVAFVYLMTSEEKYGTEARKRLLDLASWNPDGETNFRRNCEAAKPLLHRMARVYDWCYPMLNSKDKEAVQRAVRRRIQDAWVSGEVGRGVGIISRPQNSHGNRTFHKIGESAIVFHGEIPEAEVWLDFALNKFYASYPAWSDSEGGWHEGLSYWGGYMSKIVWWLDGMETALRIDGFKKPFFSNVGDFALYIASPGSPNMGFGDLSMRAPPSGWGEFLDYFKRRGAAVGLENAAHWQWWTERWGMANANDVLGFIYHAKLSDLPAAKAPVDLPKSKVFDGVGVASFHTSLVDSADDVHLLFKSSPFGSVSHGFNPQNSFQLNAYGECLLPACVYRDWYGTGFHYKWVHQTISQNAVLVNGEGQAAHKPVPGRIFGELHHEDWDYIIGDAVQAYEGKLTKAIRHVLFLRSGVIFLMDELRAPKPASFQFMLHGLSPFTINEARQTLSLQQPKAGLLVCYLAMELLTFEQWDGFDPKPLRGDFPNHWHVKAETPNKAPRADVITLLVPYKGTAAPRVTAERLYDSDKATVVELTINGSTQTIGLRKSGVAGSLDLPLLKSRGLSLDSPVVVGKPRP
jgi:hypothetical protein